MASWWQVKKRNASSPDHDGDFLRRIEMHKSKIVGSFGVEMYDWVEEFLDDLNAQMRLLFFKKRKELERRNDVIGLMKFIEQDRQYVTSFLHDKCHEDFIYSIYDALFRIYSHMLLTCKDVKAEKFRRMHHEISMLHVLFYDFRKMDCGGVGFCMGEIQDTIGSWYNIP